MQINKQMALIAVVAAALGGALTFGVLHQTGSNPPANPTPTTATGTHVLLGNGIAFTADDSVVMLPGFDMICVIDPTKKCWNSPVDSTSFFALGRLTDGRVDVLPIEVTASWGLSLDAPPPFSQFLTPAFEKKPDYVKRQVTIQTIDWGYGDPTHPPQEMTATVVEYTQKGYFGGKGDLHHVIIQNPSANTQGYLDVSYSADDDTAKGTVDELVRSLVLFYATS